MSEPEDESFIEKRENFQKTSPVTNQFQITEKSTANNYSTSAGFKNIKFTIKKGIDKIKFDDFENETPFEN